MTSDDIGDHRTSTLPCVFGALRVATPTGLSVRPTASVGLHLLDMLTVALFGSLDTVDPSQSTIGFPSGAAF